MNETIAFVALSGYVIGDATAPIRQSVQTALHQMRRAMRQDVNDGEGKTGGS